LVERIRFHLDEQIDPAIARGLRRHGIDVTTTVEAGLLSRSDLAQLEYARTSHRILVTHDTDFLRFASQSSDHPGIVRLLTPSAR
jgi:predicted nuclease of predicted toxin-antitoxin system